MKTPSRLAIEIQDPSGEIRKFRLEQKTETIGNDSNCSIPLRDPTLPPRVATLSKEGDQVWLRVENDRSVVNMAGIPLKEAQIPPQIPLDLGESRLRLVVASAAPDLPAIPNHVTAWKTCAESGAKVLWLAKKVAATSLSVYLTGETGTGKEVLAYLIHHWSDRASGPFVPIHCGALPVSLAESELFGHVKGAYTGASHARPGALMQAHNGTLFLDEIGDLSLDMQIKLLRFLENGEIRPVGADHVSRSSVRVLCATHKHLPELVREGKFRQDLYYRLASITVEIPTLRSRPEDIEMLSRDFAKAMGKELSPSALLKLMSYDWPGNVRELRHTIERVCAMAGPFHKMIDASHFPDPSHSTPQSPENSHPALAQGVLRISEMERLMLIRALRISQGHRGDAAKMLGVARSTLFEMIKRHRIPGPRAFRAETV